MAAGGHVKDGAVKPGGLLGRINPSDRAPIGLEVSEYVLNIAGVCQDDVTGEWATHVADRAGQLVGQCAVRSTWWKISELSDPGILQDAVHAAATADILMVSIRATDALSLDLHEWFEAWLPRRLPLAGALVALIGMPQMPSAGSCRIGHYLRRVAQRGQLEFLSHEQVLPWDFADSSTDEQLREASVANQGISDGIDHGHWGINE